jgi:fatty-acyl-CoA synthase
MNPRNHPLSREPRSGAIHCDLLRQTAARFPGGDRLRRVQWTRRVRTVCNRLAHGLLSVGVRTGDRVAVLSRNSHAFAALRFAIARVVQVEHEVACMSARGGSSAVPGPDMLVARDARRATGSRKSSVFRVRTSRSGRLACDLSDSLLSVTSSPPSLAIDGRSLAQIITPAAPSRCPKCRAHARA